MSEARVSKPGVGRSPIEVVAVIPARGGSKGVPRKNVRRVGGVPLVGRAVAAALAAERIDRVVVSTDDDEIAAVAEEWGAEVVRRPADIAGDTASSESALLHAVEWLAQSGVDVGVLAFLQATSPFIDPRALDEGIRLVSDGAFDAVFSAIETFGFLWQRDSRGAADGVNHDPSLRPRRQDREPHFLETGAFYVMDAAAFRSAGHRFFGSVGVVEVDETTSLEIDTPEQLELARAIAPLAPSPWLGRAIDVDAVVTDFDGVHTDDTAYIDASGAESVRVSRSDGMGVSRPARQPASRFSSCRRRRTRSSQHARRSCASTCAKPSTTRRRRCANGQGSTRSRWRASPTSATTSTTSHVWRSSDGPSRCPRRILLFSPPRGSSSRAAAAPEPFAISQTACCALASAPVPAPASAPEASRTESKGHHS